MDDLGLKQPMAWGSPMTSAAPICRLDELRGWLFVDSAQPWRDAGESTKKKPVLVVVIKNPSEKYESQLG